MSELARLRLADRILARAATSVEQGGVDANFAREAVELARLVRREERGDDEIVDGVLSSLADLSAASTLEAHRYHLPVFFERNEGPALTFLPLVKNGQRKLAAKLLVRKAWDAVELNLADVCQLQAFIEQWIAHGVTCGQSEQLGSVSVDNGKYRFYRLANDYRVFVDRHGEAWMSIEQGSKAISALMDEHLELKEQRQVTLDALREATEEVKRLGDSTRSNMFMLRDELDHYRGLFARLFEWSQGFGQALVPTSGADTFGEGIRAAKEQVGGILKNDLGLTPQTVEEAFVQGLDDHAILFRREYTSDQLEAFLAWARSKVSPAVRVAFETAVEPKLRAMRPAVLSTANELGVATDGERVVVKSAPQALTVDSALRFAAWLIVAAERAGREQALETTIVTVEAVRNT